MMEVNLSAPFFWWQTYIEARQCSVIHGYHLIAWLDT